MDVMKPVSSAAIPASDEWLYEVKYDGFRCVLYWDKHDVRLVSKNKKDLTAQFPEIVAYCQSQQKLMEPFLPLTLDGELVVLNHPYQANFSWIQKRSRLKNEKSIQKAKDVRPACLMVFDLLRENGENLVRKPFYVRKQRLANICQKIPNKRIRFVKVYENPDALWKMLFDYKGEGIVAKQKNSVYQPAKKHRDWLKRKNWRTITGFLTRYNPQNDFFTVSVYDGESIQDIGQCKHGLDAVSFAAVKQLFMTKGTKRNGLLTLPPAICALVHTLDLYKGTFREPKFARLALDTSPSTCTIEQLRLDMAMIPERVNVSNTEKLFWPQTELTKGDLLIYIREMAPYMLPFLKERALTLIRCPDGVEAESFFQKHLPDYAPNFIEGIKQGDNRSMICNDLDSLIWFANHDAVEYHVPFQKVDSNKPMEIAFDLDPPNRERFDLAIQASLLIKQMLDELDLVSFVKTSGNKGLQVHIPIPEHSMTYGETGIFTASVARTIEAAYPDLFTTERLKKKRGGRLYIDYVQHGMNKTLVAPYSPRKTDEATVATPLFWNEVSEGLDPRLFTIENVIERVQDVGCPFAAYVEAKQEQRLAKLFDLLDS